MASSLGNIFSKIVTNEPSPSKPETKNQELNLKKEELHLIQTCLIKFSSMMPEGQKKIDVNAIIKKLDSIEKKEVKQNEFPCKCGHPLSKHSVNAGDGRKVCNFHDDKFLFCECDNYESK